MPTLITSLQNRRVKDAVKLRQSRSRRRQGRLIIDGLRELMHAVNAGVEITEVYLCPEWCTSDVTRELPLRLTEIGAERFDVSPGVMAKLGYGARRDGVVGVARTPQPTLADLRLPSQPFLVVLEGVEKPGNVGAVIRTADAAGADAMVVCNGGTDLFNPNAIRASLGTIFSLPVVSATTADTVAWLANREVKTLVARVDAKADYTRVNYAGPLAIVLGNEATGLSDAWQGDRVTTIRLPMRGAADSLNVSAAAAVLLYEAQRQRFLTEI